MSDATPLRGVLLGHGSLPEGMADAVRHITGAGPEALIPISNRGRSPEALAEEVLHALGDDGGIVFTDLPGGSCGFLARKLAHSRDRIIVVSGVNLPLLIDFVMNRHTPPDVLVPRLLERGRAGLGCSPIVSTGNERRSVQG